MSGLEAYRDRPHHESSNAYASFSVDRGPLKVLRRDDVSRTACGGVGVSIEPRGVCPDTAAHTSAQLLELEGLQMSRRSET